MFRKPKAIITVNCQTGTTEAVSIAVNAYHLNRHAIYKAITEAAEAAKMRLADTNKIAAEIGKQFEDSKIKKMKDFKNKKRPKN